MVARATELAAPRPSDRALEVGAGCGYQAAVLAELCGRGLRRRDRPGAGRARAPRRWRRSATATSPSTRFDGGGGWPEHAPYDVIIVSAGAPRVPPLLVDQLADGGRLVIPVGPPQEQELAVVRRAGDHYETVVRHPLPLRRSHGPLRRRRRRRRPRERPRAGLGHAAASLLALRARPRRLPRGAAAPMHPESPAGRWYVVGAGRDARAISPRRAGVPVEDILEINGLAARRACSRGS